MVQAVPSYMRYWGKARPTSSGSAPYHLLAYHSLDVAACGQILVRSPRFSLHDLALKLGMDAGVVERVFVYFLSLHDFGKFAPSFQMLSPESLAALQPGRRVRPVVPMRHDALGWLLWRKEIANRCSEVPVAEPRHSTWDPWARTVFGHHGLPPDIRDGPGMRVTQVSEYFEPDDVIAAVELDEELRGLFQVAALPHLDKPKTRVLKDLSWRLAGLAVLADWLGSSTEHFSYLAEPISLAEYWDNCAITGAEQAIASAGLAGVRSRSVFAVADLLPSGAKPSPLQCYASDVEITDGAQLFLLEDVPGAGKTEAALILTQRLMAAGRARGFYFALPTMATATQMYRRVGHVYRRMFDPADHPSLVLAHSASGLVEMFRESVLPSSIGSPVPSANDTGSDSTAECAAWLADSRKKALLADVGVGTIDQALLGVLPVRHQALRLLGLSDKVLIVDEVHACDTYVIQLLEVLLEYHARSGGSAILLSATLPACLKQRLLSAFGRGRDTAYLSSAAADERYPLATHAGVEVRTHSCQTREPLRRTVRVEMLHDEEAVIELMSRMTAQGRCVGWIRNTVDDARRAYHELSRRLSPDVVTLFHSRYALGHRLVIEESVVNRFGVSSSAETRRGQVLVGTQVLEQSLDYDVDVMVSDWAPIDLIIQRAGRLMRHPRTKDGNRSPNGVDQRGKPILHVLVPSLDSPPEQDWYAALFPKGQYVYPDIGGLWLGADAQRRAGGIDTPGDPGAPASVRSLVEAVYGERAAPVPEPLVAATSRASGEAKAREAMGVFNSLQIERGYSAASSPKWAEDDKVPTRLGEETRTVYLAVATEAGLVPLTEDLERPWENSAVRVDARRVQALTDGWHRQFAQMIEGLRRAVPLLRAPAFILPLVAKQDGLLHTRVVDSRGRELDFTYDELTGLAWNGGRLLDQGVTDRDVQEG